MNLILLTSDEIGERGVVTLTDRRADHIRDVLRGREGQSLRVGQLNGPIGTGMIQSVQPDTVTLRCTFNTAAPEQPSTDLLLAMPRPKVMKRLWAPLASLGVGRIIITNAQKVERYYFDSHVLEPDFYTAQLKEGLEQAMDTRLPEVTIHRQLKALIEGELDALSPDSFRIVADPAGTTHIIEVVKERRQPRTLLAVGPEGGWSEYELDLFKAHGFRTAGIGPRLLRSDTACIALLALAHME